MERENKISLLFIVVLIINLIGCCLNMGTFIANQVYYQEEVDYNFINMSNKEILQAKSLIRDMQPNFLSCVKEITFVRNDSYCDFYSNNDCLGMNTKDKIIVEWQDDLKEYVKICNKRLAQQTLNFKESKK